MTGYTADTTVDESVLTLVNVALLSARIIIPSSLAA